MADSNNDFLQETDPRRRGSDDRFRLGNYDEEDFFKNDFFDKGTEEIKDAEKINDVKQDLEDIFQRPGEVGRASNKFRKALLFALAAVAIFAGGYMSKASCEVVNKTVGGSVSNGGKEVKDGDGKENAEQTAPTEDTSTSSEEEESSAQDKQEIPGLGEKKSKIVETGQIIKNGKVQETVKKQDDSEVKVSDSKKAVSDGTSPDQAEAVDEEVEKAKNILLGTNAGEVFDKLPDEQKKTAAGFVLQRLSAINAIKADRRAEKSLNQESVDSFKEAQKGLAEMNIHLWPLNELAKQFPNDYPGELAKEEDETVEDEVVKDEAVDKEPAREEATKKTGVAGETDQLPDKAAIGDAGSEPVAVEPKKRKAEELIRRTSRERVYQVPATLEEAERLLKENMRERGLILLPENLEEAERLLKESMRERGLLVDEEE